MTKRGIYHAIIACQSLMLLIFMYKKTTENTVHNEKKQDHVIAEPDLPRRIIYNRVPKCASSSLLDMMSLSSRINNFTLIQSSIYMNFVLELSDEKEMVKTLKGDALHLLYERHYHFVDFNRYGISPDHVNLVRDPLQRMVSWYYYRRFQDGHRRTMTDADRNMTFNECVLSKHSECWNPHGDKSEVGYFKIIPFFCGQHHFCRLPGDEALSQAVKNVKKYYTIIGITEKFNEFIYMLEQLYPKYFKGISNINDVLGESLHNKYKTLKKDEITMQVGIIMRKKLHQEYLFYDFLKRRFDSLLDTYGKER